ncbi:MAG: hypothetical protein ACLFR8_07280 [Alkalispirochaeta sp.]
MVPRLRSDTVDADALHSMLDGDGRFDLFADDAVSVSDTAPFVRPAIVSGTRVVWGFRYRTVLPRPGGTDLPVLRVVDDATPAVSGRRAGSERHTGAAAPGGVEPVTEVDLIMLALTAEGRAGSYRWSEIDAVVGLVESGTGEEGVPRTIRNALDPDRDVLEVLARYRRLPAPLRDALDAGAIDIRTAEAIPEELLSRLPALLDGVSNCTFSERRQAIRIIVDLIRRGDRSPDDLLAFLRSDHEGGLLPALRRLRYPEISRLDDAIASFRNRYTRGTGIVVAFPEHYEGDHLSVSFRIRSSRELANRIAALRRMEEGVDELLGLLL